MAKMERPVVLVTGASRNIGRAIALRFARGGYDVAFTYLTRGDLAGEVCGLLEEEGARTLALEADQGKPSDNRRVVEETVTGLGRLDVLVNNVGIFQLWQPETSDEESLRLWEETMAVNARGVFLISAAAAHHLSPGGAIVNISTTIARFPTPGCTIYAASKAALEAITRNLALELGPQQIRVNAISLGAVEAGLGLTYTFATEEGRRATIAATPLRRAATPEDAANIAFFLADAEASAWVTGQTIMASGGQFVI